MPHQLVMSASPGCGLLMHAPAPKPPLHVPPEKPKADVEELRVEKKLRAMLEKKVSAISARMETEIEARKAADEMVEILRHELADAKETASSLGDVRDTFNSLQREVDQMRQTKKEAMDQLATAEKENRNLKLNLAEAEKVARSRETHMGELVKEWTEQIDNLVMRETILEREKESLSSELDKTKNEHQILLQHAQKLVARYEEQTESRLDLEERQAQLESRCSDKVAGCKDELTQERQKKQQLEEENARLQRKIQRLEEDATECNAQIRSLTTMLGNARKDDPKHRVGRQIRIDKPLEPNASSGCVEDAAAKSSGGNGRKVSEREEKTRETSTATSLVERRKDSCKARPRLKETHSNARRPVGGNKTLEKSDAKAPAGLHKKLSPEDQLERDMQKAMLVQE